MFPDTTLNNLHKKLAVPIVVDYGKIEIKEETLANLIKLLCTIYGQAVSLQVMKYLWVHCNVICQIKFLVATFPTIYISYWQACTSRNIIQ